jgi:membrane associated rhomboid family serine protease
MDLSNYPITAILIAANVIISLIGFNNANTINQLIMWPYGVKRSNQYYRFISSGFIHADFIHLLFNMITLYSFGSAVEQIFSLRGLGGSVTYLALYFLGLIVSDLPTYFKQQNNSGYRSLGASGAVSAVVFACILFAPWSIIYLYAIPIPFLAYAVLYLVYCVYMSKRSADNINHDAHLWGSVFGLGFTLLLMLVFDPAMIQDALYEITHPHF